jgi:hypothetical protein
MVDSTRTTPGGGSSRNIYRCVFFEPRLGLNFKFQNGKAFVSSFDEDNFVVRKSPLSPSSVLLRGTTRSSTVIDDNPSRFQTPVRAVGPVCGGSHEPGVSASSPPGQRSIPTASAVIVSSSSGSGGVAATVDSVIVLDNKDISQVGGVDCGRHETVSI